MNFKVTFVTHFHGKNILNWEIRTQMGTVLSGDSLYFKRYLYKIPQSAESAYFGNQNSYNLGNF